MKEYHWEVAYVDPEGVDVDIITRLNKMSEINSPSIFIDPRDLVTSKVLIVKSSMTNPFGLTFESNELEITVPSIASGKKHCGPCQLKDRNKCRQFNGICWENYMDYSVTEPLAISSCYKAMAPTCYYIWKTLSRGDSQCLDFKPFYDYAAMQVKPTPIMARYTDTGKAIYLTFDLPIFKSFIDCADVFDKATTNWLPPSKSCRLETPTTLVVDYNPHVGIMEEIGIKANRFYYDYPYAQEPADPVKLKIRLPPLTTEIKIMGLTTISECDPLDLIGVVVTPTLYPLVFKWELEYDPLLSEELMYELGNYTLPYTNYTNVSTLTIPDKFMKVGTKIHVTLSAKASSFDSDVITTSTTVNVLETIPKVKFTSKKQYVQELDGSQSNALPLEVDNYKCGEGAKFMNVSISFKVYSGGDSNSMLAHNEEEIAIEASLEASYKKLQEIFVGVKQGFKYLKYYKITATIKTQEFKETNSDTIIVYIVKPPVKSVIDSPGSLVGIQNDVYLSGKRSEFPAVDEDQTYYLWRCVNATVLELAGSCSCPVFAESELKANVLRIPKEKLMNMCSYKFALTVAAIIKNYKRLAYSETEFMTYEDSVDSLKEKTITTSDSLTDSSDVYLTFETSSNHKDEEVEYEWKMVEVESTDPNVDTKYSEKNSFVYDFYKDELGADVNPAIKNDDTPLPNEGKRRRLADLTPQYLTSTKNRILGIKTTGLLPSHKYTFGVTVNYPDHPTFLFVPITTSPTVRPRNFIATPTTGFGFQTPFVFTISLQSSTEVDEAQYQIYRRNCPSKSSVVVPITQPFSRANSYTLTLAPGFESCNYEVEIILRVTEYGKSLDVKQNLTVKMPQLPIEEIIKLQAKKLDDNTALSFSQKLNILAEITSMEIKDIPELAKMIARSIINQLSSIDNPAGILETLEEKDRPGFINLIATILTNLATKIKLGIDVSVASSIASRIEKYLTQLDVTQSRTYMVPGCLSALSGLVDIAKGTNNEGILFKIIQIAMEKMAELKMTEMMAGSVPYLLSTPTMEMAVMKDFAIKFNTTKRLNTYKNAGITLEGGLGDKVVKALRLRKGSITAAATLYSMSFNPYSDIKTNARINTASLNRESTQGVFPETLKGIYDDLAKGKFANVINVREQSMAIVQLIFKPFEMKKDASEKNVLNATVGIRTISEMRDLVVTIPAPRNLTEYIRKSTLVPLYYVPEEGIWTNENCTLDPLNVSDSFITVRCRNVGSRAAGSAQRNFIITVDALTNINDLVQVASFGKIVSSASLVEDPDRNLAAYTTVSAILILIIAIQALLVRLDREAMHYYRVACLNKRLDPKKESVQSSTLNDLYVFFNKMQRKGLNALAKEAQKVPTHAPTDAERRLQVKPLAKRANGYNYLSKDERTELRDMADTHEQCKEVYKGAELEEITLAEFSQSPVLDRMTQCYIDNSNASKEITFCTLMANEHPLINAVAKTEVTSPRYAKFLICMCAIVGQLFMSGGFYDVKLSTIADEESTAHFIRMAVLYGFIVALLTIPLKILLSIFLLAGKPAGYMTRAEIEAAERRTPIMRTIGLILAYAWLIASLLMAATYIRDFKTFDLNKWLIAFLITIIFELLVFFLLRLTLKVLLGLFLAEQVKAKYMTSEAGSVMGRFINLVAKVC